MAEYIEIGVTRTSKVAGKDTRWERFDHFNKSFPDMAALNKWLKDHYGNCTKTKTYIDTKSGSAEHTGWVYKWTEKGSVQGDYGTYYMQDWVTVLAITARNPIKQRK